MDPRTFYGPVMQVSKRLQGAFPGQDRILLQQSEALNKFFSQHNVCLRYLVVVLSWFICETNLDYSTSVFSSKSNVFL